MSDKAIKLSQAVMLYNDLRQRVEKANDDILEKAPAILCDASGDVLTITDGADGMALKSCTVQINLAQSGSGDPSSENVRPISGRNGCVISCVGQLVDEDITIVNGYYDADGSSKASAGMRRTDTYVPSVPGMTYMIVGTTASDASDNSRVRVHEYDENQVWLRQVYVSDGIPRKTKVYQTWTSSDDAAYFRLSWPKFAVADPIKIHSEANQYLIDWQTSVGTVYGGILDTVAKKLTVTDEQIASYAGETLPGEWISDRDVYTPEGTPTIGAQVVYKLATPIVYTLTDIPVITTLMGYNSIWADTGAVSLTYSADTKTYVDTSLPAGSVEDVRINGTSIIQNGIANVPLAASNVAGVVKTNSTYGTDMNEDTITVKAAISTAVKAGEDQ